MRVTPARGALVGLAMLVGVFAAAEADFAAGDNTAVPTQWTVGGDEKFAEEADDYVSGLLDVPSVESVLGDDVFDSPWSAGDVATRAPS